MCQISSSVERRFCKPYVAGSIPASGLVALAELLLYNCYVSFLLICQSHQWAVSSAGRAMVLQSIGQRFDPATVH